MLKMMIISAVLITTSAFSSEETEMSTRHYNRANNEALLSVGFMASGMIAVPIEEYLCKKFSVGPKTEVSVKILSGLVFGGLAYYSAGRSVQDFALAFGVSKGW